jgi:cytochrome c oxidase subunit 2
MPIKQTWIAAYAVFMTATTVLSMNGMKAFSAGAGADRTIGSAARSAATSAASGEAGSSDKSGLKIIKVTAKRFEYVPQQITLKKGVPTVIQLTTEDRSHGFNIPLMKLRVDIEPGKVAELKLTPQKSGEFDFFCDIFCGSGHEGMNGKITVTE